MANSDTIFALNGPVTSTTTPVRNQLQNLTGLATAETILNMGTDASATQVGAFLPFVGQTAILGRSNPMSINANPAILTDQYGAKVGERGVMAPYYNSGSFDARAIRCRLQGRFLTSAASNTITVKFYAQTVANGAVLASAKLLGSIAIGGAGIGNAVSGSLIAECTAMWDSVSANFQGCEVWGSAAGFYASRAVNSTTVAVAAPLTNWILIASVTFVAGAANAFSPIEFAYEDM